MPMHGLSLRCVWASPPTARSRPRTSGRGTAGPTRAAAYWVLAAPGCRIRRPTAARTIGWCGGGAATTGGMATPEELANWYAGAWNETDPAKRRGLLESACSPDIRFLQEGWDHEVVGIDALDQVIADFQ